MTRRKINIDKLTEKQLKTAQDKISEKINTTVDNLVAKWSPKLEKFNIDLKIQVAIDEENSLDIKDKQFESLIDQYKDSEDLPPTIEELDDISKKMIDDLNLAVSDCNKLLSRYGMACDMAYANND